MGSETEVQSCSHTPISADLLRITRQSSNATAPGVSSSALTLVLYCVQRFAMMLELNERYWSFQRLTNQLAADC